MIAQSANNHIAQSVRKCFIPEFVESKVLFRWQNNNNINFVVTAKHGWKKIWVVTTWPVDVDMNFVMFVENSGMGKENVRNAI